MFDAPTLSIFARSNATVSQESLRFTSLCCSFQRTAMSTSSAICFANWTVLSTARFVDDNICCCCCKYLLCKYSMMLQCKYFFANIQCCYIANIQCCYIANICCAKISFVAVQVKTWTRVVPQQNRQVRF